jgi:hypothetical protein
MPKYVTTDLAFVSMPEVSARVPRMKMIMYFRARFEVSPRVNGNYATALEALSDHLIG